MKNKLFWAACVILIVLATFPLTAFASGNDPLSLPSSTENSKSVITPNIVVYQFDHYSESTHSISWTMEYVGTLRVDNSANKYTSATMIFTASDSGSWSAAITYGTTIGAEVDAVVATVKAEVSISGTLTRTWTVNHEYGTSTEVPPGKIGTIKAYIPGTSSKGTAYYRRYDTEQSGYTIVLWGLGGYVPAYNSWNMVISIQ